MQYLKDNEIPLRWVTTVIGTVVGLVISTVVSAKMDEKEYIPVNISMPEAAPRVIPIEDDVPWEN